MAKKERNLRPRKESWRGILGEGNRFYGIMYALIMLVVLASLTFMQLGFIGIGADGDYLAYIMTPLAFCAAGSLLYGARRGALFGLCCGVILFAHATFQPLDVYECFLVGPFNSIVLLTFCAFMFGLLFKVALRNDPHGVRRWVYIAICCLIMAFVETMLFFANGLADIIISVALGNKPLIFSLSTGDGTQLTGQFTALANSLSMSVLQLPFNFVFMMLACVAVSWVVKQHKKPTDKRAMRSVFQSWLLVVIVCAHMATNAVMFVINTEHAKSTAFDRMDGEISYLEGQLEDRNKNAEIIGEYISSTLDQGYTISKDMEDKLMSLSGADAAIQGYDKATDGTVTIYEDDVVVMTNDDRYPVGSTLTDSFGMAATSVFAELSENGGVQELLYDPHPTKTEVLTNGESFRLHLVNEESMSTQISYLKAKQFDNYTVMMEMPSSMVFVDRLETTLGSSLSALVLLSAVYFLAARLLKHIVTDEIEEINENLGDITDGKLDTKVEVRQSAEFAELSDGINTTVDALKGWINEAETRMATDLATAKAIQASNLPRTFPPFPEIDRFDIYASMNPAKEVGGDFFDFFLIDDNTLGFLIADVSGKGIPGALFMMAAKSEIENHMQTGMGVDQAIASANARLCANNDADMFVTVWAATLDYNTGELTYVNAGHNPPLLRHNGEWQWLTKKGGLFLGTYPTAKYRSHALTLEDGDEIMLYTDGVNEAFSANDEEYGNDRLEAFLQGHANMHPRELVQDLRADVARWAKGVEQSDDITMVCLEYGEAPEVSGTATYVASLDKLGTMMAPIQKELSDRLCPIDVQHKVEIALEEMLVNVCRYAYEDQDEPGKVQISYVYRAEPHSITVEIIDWGKPFDPLTRRDPTKPASIQEAPIGGLGIFMTKKSVDDITYIRDDGENILCFRKVW